MSGVRFPHRPHMEEERIQNIEREIELIKERNLRVEADKAWEVSWTRQLFIAVVPAVGYLLSTLSLPFIKKWWIKKYS